MHRRSNRLIFFCFVWIALTSVVMVAACTPTSTKGQAGDPCTTNDDCDSAANLECRAKNCRTPLEKQPPVARVTSTPDAPEVGQKVELDGSGSRDPQNNLLVYEWSIKTKPDKSDSKLQNADKPIASFTPDQPGEYVFTLKVAAGSEKDALSTTKDLTVSVADKLNTKPIADAGPDQLLEPNSKAQLDGSKSFDGEADKLSFAWTVKSKPDGSAVSLTGGDTDKPSFTVDAVGDYVIELIVTDERGLKSAPDTVTIRVMEGASKTPAVTKVTPAEGFAYELSFKVSVEGSDLFKDAKIEVNNHTFDTTYVSNTKLDATLNLALIGEGTHKLYIINPNGKRSDTSVDLVVKASPPPSLTSLNPPQGHIGNKVTIKAIGKNFITGKSEVLFQSVPLPTRVLSATELEFDLDLKNTPEGEYPVQIQNPGSQNSNILQFRVLGALPKPTLNVLNPPSAAVGAKLAFSVHGTGFGVGAVIVFDGKKIPTKRIRRDELQADPVLDLTNVKAGEYDVWVENPDGQISSKEVFRISEVDPTPTLNRMLPFTLYLDEVMVDVAVYGQDFMKGAKLYIDGKEITGALGKVVYRSDTFLLAEINLTDRTKWTTAGNLDAVVENPNGKKSAPFKLTVSYRVPSVTSLIPSSWTNQCDTDVEVQGTNFVKTVQVTIGSQTYKVGSTTHPLTFVSDKLLKFKLIATKLSAGTLKVKVENGPQASTTAPDFIVDSGATNTPYINYVRPSIGQADTVVPIYIYPNSKVTNGSRSFKPGAVVEVNGKKMATQCGLSSLGYCYNITANVDLSGFKAGEYDLHVVNPCGVKSAPVGFAVEAPPTPTVSKITPTFAKIGDKTKITFTGTNFAKAHTLLWNGQTIKTVHKSDKEIETADPIDFASAKLGDINVEIKNANGQTTGVMKFSVINKYAPTITEVSNNVQQRGRVLSDLIIKGTGFVVTSRVTINGKTAPVRFTSPTELKVAGYDATNDNPGIYSIQVRNGSRGSNMYPLTLLPIPGPRIDYINPASIVEGSPSTKFTLYIYGSNFNTTGTPKAAVEFLDPKGKDITNGRYTSSYESTTYMRGSLEVGGLTSGKYVIRVKNPDGTYSNNTIFQITPPPPPVAASLSPAAVFRGTPKQQVLISGSNFATGDEIIFNNNVLAAIPGTVQNGSLIGTINLAGIAYAKDYDVYVRRCVDKPACTKYETTKTLKLYINNPPCSLVNCQTQMPTPEKCDNASNPPVCLPPCTTTADCTKLDAKAPWTCQTGVCK